MINLSKYESCRGTKKLNLIKLRELKNDEKKRERKNTKNDENIVSDWLLVFYKGNSDNNHKTKIGTFGT